mmetsp:Transcript_34130/g.49529  ORF Transcript_34130/g.49529 Transcript_34130/m.49529 type:complete len:875 (-) Transcript_34130:267-2891(-)
MNSLGGHPESDTRVTRECFSEHFLTTLELSDNFGPTVDQTAALYDEICALSPGDTTFITEDFYNSRLQDFLDDIQINDMLKKLRDGGKAVFASNRVTVSKEDFVAAYPDILNKIALGDDQTIHQKVRGIDLAFESLCLEVSVAKKKIKILDNLTGRIKAGTMTALMGGSGAGKTSMLNSLCGRAYYGQVTGKVFVNGHAGGIEDHKGSVGFVPQDDIMYAELTVKENLLFAGRFKLPAGTPENEIEDLADKVMASLGLSRIANSRVGDVNRRGVSGGEKKRVNIGIELMAKPKILFLDEPTSGLDASSAMLCMSSLRKLVDRENVTVTAVIHQPRKFIFELFDSVILLSVGGKMVYHGDVFASKVYFSELGYVLPDGENIADWMIDISSGELKPEGDKMRKSTISSRSSDLVDDLEMRKNSTSRRSCIASIAIEQNTVAVSPHQSAVESAKGARKVLNEKWAKHMATLDEIDKKDYSAPPPYDLPEPVQKQPFFMQLLNHIIRNIIVISRNGITKVVDAFILMIAVIAISLLNGTLEITKTLSTADFDSLLVTSDPKPLLAQWPNLTSYSARAYTSVLQYNLQIGVIISVLVSLAAAKVISEKRIEFFREAGSGYDINAYFLALNFTSTIEYAIQMLLASGSAYWLRNSLVGYETFVINFLLLSWVSSAWAFFFASFMPPKNLTITTAFFITFTCLLFSGGIAPFEYKDIYAGVGYEILCGAISATRFFQESMVVSEYRCLPEQAGFAISDDAEYLLNNYNTDTSVNGFSYFNLAMRDHDTVVGKSCDGWFWGVLPSFFIGLTLRAFACVFLHILNRGQQAKKKFVEELRVNGKLKDYATVFVTTSLLIFLTILSGYFIIRGDLSGEEVQGQSD